MFISTNRLKKYTLFASKVICVLSALSLASCAPVPVIYVDANQERVDFGAVVATFPEYRNAPLPQAITPLTQQSIQLEIERQRTAARSNPKPDADLDSTYRVGVGDILNIVVWDHPELSFEDTNRSSDEPRGSIVSATGSIFYPYVGSVPVENLTVDQIRNKLTSLLAVTIENPQLEVQVSEYRSKKAFVGGELSKPGLQKITDVPLTLIDAITDAGGATDTADLSNATLTRQNKEYKLNLTELFVHGGGALNFTLQDGDVLTVPSLTESKYYVLGQVVTPVHNAVTNNQLSLSEALLQAGGVKRAAKESIHIPVHVFVIRGTESGTLVFHLDRAASDAVILGDNFHVKPNDIIYIATERPSNWNLTYQQILRFSSLSGVK